MKTLKDFTSEIQNLIPSYINNALYGIFDGQRYNNFNFKDAEEAVNLNYEFSGFKKPVVLVAENPYEAQIIFNYVINNKYFINLIYYLYKLKNNIETFQLDSQLNSQLDNQLYIQLRNQLYSQLNSQLNSQLYNQLHNQLYIQLHNQLYSQLNSQLRSQLDRQLDSQLGSKLRSQLDSQLFKYNNPYLFTLNIYSNVYLMWYKFIKDQFNIKCTISDILDNFTEKYLNSNIYNAIFSEILCVVSKYPKKIYRNNNLDLHNINGNAVEWGSIDDFTKFECFYINGRNIPKEIYNKAFILTLDDFLNEENEDYKAAWFEILGSEKMFEILKATEIETMVFNHYNNYTEKISLYKTNFALKNIGNKPLSWLKMTCPSTGTNYLISTNPDFKDVESAIKFHRPSFVSNDIDYKWNSAN